MEIRIAEYAGFCYGVKKAIDDTEEILKTEGPSKALGALIHNPLEVDRLKKLGLQVIDTAAEAEGERVIIRSHGEAKQVIEQLETSKNTVFNCTCPYVSKIHRIVSDYYAKKYGIIIIGDSTHPEVIGINGWCDNSATIIDTVDAARLLEIDGPTCIVGQTTFNTELWENMINILRSKSEQVVVFNTICDATAKRQQAARELASQADCMIVVGGKNSSNSKKLYEICRSICAATYFVESADELSYEEFAGDVVIGITAGASTPDWVIQEIINKFRRRGNC
ncbi:MAG: 4-hydroxy-3-methylbut-2-enyl diphosphate reductase [Clostridia bacterium]|nr:4-hydroxy-3-methylbut-2-enyl diphosphate reductase [Clostridia bacterium]